MVAEVLTNHGMDVRHTKPALMRAGRLDIKGLGHAGVCILEAASEAAYYYEFGRYDQEQQGEVRISLAFGVRRTLDFSDKDPEVGSLQQVCDQLRLTNQPGGVNFKSAYIKTSDGAAATMKQFAEGQIPNGRATYDLNGNHCMTFALDVAQAGRVDVSAARTNMGFNLTQRDKESISRIIDEYDIGVVNRVGAWWKEIDVQARKDAMKEETIQKAGEAMGNMQVPAFQINALQSIYKKLDHQPFAFEGFPLHPYERK